MSRMFEELDYQLTPIGALSLRRRRDLTTGDDIFEIKLGDEFLMSSLFTSSEIALGRLGVSELAAGDYAKRDGFDIVVGGLGLGYTARAVLEHDAVGSLVVVDTLAAVIEWHETGLLPLGAGLSADPRCRFVHGDFFELSASVGGFDAAHPGAKYDAILVDIDHSPEQLLDDGSAGFYLHEGLQRVASHLHPGGVFGLWSNDRPDAAFVARLKEVFAVARGEPVVFHNPIQNREAVQTVYLARAHRG